MGGHTSLSHPPPRGRRACTCMRWGWAVQFWFNNTDTKKNENNRAASFVPPFSNIQKKNSFLLPSIYMIRDCSKISEKNCGVLKKWLISGRVESDNNRQSSPLWVCLMRFISLTLLKQQFVILIWVWMSIWLFYLARRINSEFFKLL